MPAFVLAKNNHSNNKSKAPAKVLFLTNVERGQANVHLATAHALLSEYADSFQIHFASFPDISAAVEQVSRHASQDASKQITFHAVQGKSHMDACMEKGLTMKTVRQAPGLRGSERFSFFLKRVYMPWSGPAYIEVASSIREIIAEVQPDLAVIDILFAQGVDAVEATMGNHSHVILSPNDMKDMLATVHP
jgi:hypothetical protein